MRQKSATFRVKKLLHFASKVVTFRVNVTFCVNCYILRRNSPGGPGGEVLPIMESFFSNNGQIMLMDIISLILVCPQLVRDFYTTQQLPPYNLRRSDFVLPRVVTVTYGRRSSWNSHVNSEANLSLARRKRDCRLFKNERHNCHLCNF